MTHVRYESGIYFSRQGTGRFDGPYLGYGVCYFGTSLDCCLLEVFASAVHRRSGRITLSLAHLREYRVVAARARRPLRFAQLADSGLFALGIDQRVTGGNDYLISRRWGAAIHAHPDAVDGIYYASRHHNGLHSVAFFDRSALALEVDELGHLGDPSQDTLWVALNAFLDRYQVALVVEDGDHARPFYAGS